MQFEITKNEKTGTYLPNQTCQPNLQLIPIKIEYEYESRKVKDIFLWDKSEPYWDLETFSKIYVEELNLP